MGLAGNVEIARVLNDRKFNCEAKSEPQEPQHWHPMSHNHVFRELLLTGETWNLVTSVLSMAAEMRLRFKLE